MTQQYFGFCYCVKGGIIYWVIFLEGVYLQEKQQVIFCQGEPEMEKMLDNGL